MSTCNVHGGAVSFNKHTETHLFGHLYSMEVWVCNIVLVHWKRHLRMKIGAWIHLLCLSRDIFHQHICAKLQKPVWGNYLAQLMLAANLSPYPVSTVKNEPVTASGRAVASPLPPQTQLWGKWDPPKCSIALPFVAMVTKGTNSPMHHRRVVFYSGLKQGIGRAFKLLTRVNIHLTYSLQQPRWVN